MNINEFMPLVRKIAVEIHRTVPSSVQLDDLIQDGMIGLIMAFREHNADSGAAFTTFAWNKIRWSIIDGLRVADWAESSVRRRASKVAKIIDELQASLQRNPSKVEIADALGVRVEDVASILGDAYGYDFVSVDEVVQGKSLEIPDSSLEPSVLVEKREAYSRAVAGLKTLQPNERRAFVLRVMCDLSGVQTAIEMGLSESRVSQLHKMAAEKLDVYIKRRVLS